MKTNKHGLSVGIERVADNFFLTMKVNGKLTHNDYEVITPMIESALEGIKSPKINALIDATALEGWEARAAWDDFKLGLKHGNKFVKVAIYGNKKWQKFAAKIGSWFVAGEIKYFDEESEALNWLND